MIALLLAAGLSTRMGCQKLLLPFGNSTVVETVLDNISRAGCFSEVCAVFSKEVAEKLTPHTNRFRAEINPAPERGQSSSLLIGLGMVPDGEDFCIMLGDLPLARAESIARLAAAFGELPPDKSVLTPSRNGGFGHPMFYRSVWKERFQSATGDMGGRKLLMNHDTEIVRVEAPDGHFRDLDTPEDYKNIIKDN